MRRTWKCPECGHTEEIGYEWLAEHGGPVCGSCDCDMELQPESEATAVVERLVDKAEAAGLDPEDLDELVHDLTASVAADVNNGGLEDQIRYLVDRVGAQRTEQQLDEVIESQPRGGN
jgi:peptide subunit release factor 1 (eRF1)